MLLSRPYYDVWITSFSIIMYSNLNIFLHLSYIAAPNPPVKDHVVGLAVPARSGASLRALSGEGPDCAVPDLPKTHRELHKGTAVELLNQCAFRLELSFPVFLSPEIFPLFRAWRIQPTRTLGEATLPGKRRSWQSMHAGKRVLSEPTYPFFNLQGVCTHLIFGSQTPEGKD